MKLIFLNTWQGKTGEPFADFMRTHADSTDVFCLQETNDLAKTTCSTLLPKHHLTSATKLVLHFRAINSTLSASHTELVSSQGVFLDRSDVGLGLYTEILVGGKIIHIFNFHGSSRPTDKLDNPSRLDASRGIINFMSGKVGPKIIGGDFNLLPETESVLLFEKNGYHNHVMRNNIATTRNHLAWDLYPDKKQYYADYVFTSPDVCVQKFSVIANEVSDHLPLILECTL